MTTGHDLAGLRVVVTRPAGQAEGFCREIEAAGGLAVRLPVIEIEAVRPDVAAGQNRGRGGYDLVVFVSANAVRFGLPWLDEVLCRGGERPRVAAIGHQTAAALASAGVAVDVVPVRGADSEALLAMPGMQLAEGRRVLIVRGVGGRELIARTLRARSVEVEYLEVYRRRPIPELASVIDRLAGCEGADVVTVTSNAILGHLHDAAVRGHCREWLLGLPLFVMGSRGFGLARELGFWHVVMTDGSGVSGFIAALGQYVADLRRKEGGRP